MESATSKRQLVWNFLAFPRSFQLPDAGADRWLTAQIERAQFVVR